MKQRVFNMSGVYAEEGFHPSDAEYLDFTSLEGTNCYCSEEAASAIRSNLSPGKYLNWIDTGDYHYLTSLLTSTVPGPFDLLLIDHHPDNQESFILSCGGWINSCGAHQVHTIGVPGSIRTFPAGDTPLYISLDLDVLDRSVFSTNWDQGHMGLNDLLSVLAEYSSGRSILGIDVCGGISISKGACSCELESNRKFRESLSIDLFNLFKP